jgi:hypothetical protein
MKWRENPLYRPRPTWKLRGRALWAWRAVLAAIFAWFLIAENYVGAGIYAALWVVAELLTLRRESRNSNPGEGAGELGEDGEVSMKPDALKPSDAEWQ